MKKFLFLIFLTMSFIQCKNKSESNAMMLMDNSPQEKSIAKNEKQALEEPYTTDTINNVQNLMLADSTSFSNKKNKNDSVKKLIEPKPENLNVTN